MNNPFAGLDAYETVGTASAPLLPGLCFYPWFMRLIYRYRRDVCRGSTDRDYFPARSLDVIRRIESCGGRFSVTGLNHLRTLQGSAVYVSNHMSTLETVALPGFIHLFHPVTFVVKESLVHGPLFGPVMRSREPVVVSRRNPRADLIRVLREGRSRLAEGISVILFPQGTRSRRFHSRDFNSLGVKLARRAAVPLIPLALKTDFWPNGRLIRPLGRLHPERTIHMAFAPPLSPDRSPEEMHRHTLEHIRGHLLAWGMADSWVR